MRVQAGYSKANAAVQWVVGHKSADSEMPQNATGSREVLHSALLSRRLHKGDVTMLPSLQVTLNPSALSANDTGHSATVAAAGGNKAAVKKGTAVFKDVRIAADVGGQYVLRAASGSRKVCWWK